MAVSRECKKRRWLRLGRTRVISWVRSITKVKYVYDQSSTHRERFDGALPPAPHLVVATLYGLL